jgi:hypothetical protein
MVPNVGQNTTWTGDWKLSPPFVDRVKTSNPKVFEKRCQIP